MNRDNLIEAWDSDIPFTLYIGTVKHRNDDGSYIFDGVTSANIHCSSSRRVLHKDLSSTDYNFSKENREKWDSLINKIEIGEVTLPFKIL